MEVWKRSIVPGTEHLFVSDLGRVKFPAFTDTLGRIYKERITRGCRWYDKSKDSYYRRIYIHTTITVHRLVCFAFHEDSYRFWLDCVDHIDQDSENNNSSNLRFTTNQLNAYNSDKYLGYTKRGNKFQAYVTYNSQQYYKTFKTTYEARTWYLAEKAKYIQLAEQELVEIEASWQWYHEVD